MGTTLISTLLFACSVIVAHATYNHPFWNYDHVGEIGPNHWPGDCNKLSSTRQSPINIMQPDTVKRQFSDLSFSGYTDVDAVMVNNGHTVQVTVDSASHAVVTGGGLPGTYKLAQFHLHWGSSDDQGSEHEINGRQYPMEVHFVHYNTKYVDLSTAASKADGLAVLAWVFDVSSQENMAYRKIFEGLKNIKYTDSPSYHLRELDIRDYMGATSNFFRYQGSLTTPPCFQSVTWTIFRKPIRIGKRQLRQIRAVQANKAGRESRFLSDNFRPIQPLNNRKVYVNK